MTPLYARLPRGPHRMERGEVAANQRQRMHGAMVEAVSASGYGATSVKQVISLAGVSRRAFYEQFSNKQECFLSTLDLLAGRAMDRVSSAYRSTDGEIEARMRGALRELAELVASNPKSAHVALIDAPEAGPAGWAALTRTLFQFERMLTKSFACTPGSAALPVPVVRAIAGGVHMMVLVRVHRERTEELPQLTEEMLDWTLTFGTAGRVSGRNRGASGLRASAGAGTVAQEAPTGRTRQRAGRWRADRAAAEGERARLLESALEMIALEGYAELSPLRIVDRAGVSIDTFFELFGDIEGCVLVALTSLSEELLQELTAVELGPGEGWAGNVRRALDLLMRHFSERPGYAHMVTAGALEVGAPAVDLSLALAGEIADRLTAGAPPSPVGPTVREGIAGAIWHTIYCHVSTQQTDRLQTGVDHLAYIVLTPFMGRERAFEALVSERSARSITRLAERTAANRALAR